MKDLINLVIGILIIFVYFLPTVIASKRASEKIYWICALNLFLGWTVVGWIAAIVWAFQGKTFLETKSSNISISSIISTTGWVFVALCSVNGAITIIIGLFGSSTNSAVQEAAITAFGIAWAVIPYCFVKAISMLMPRVVIVKNMPSNENSDIDI